MHDLLYFLPTQILSVIIRKKKWCGLIKKRGIVTLWGDNLIQFKEFFLWQMFAVWVLMLIWASALQTCVPMESPDKLQKHPKPVFYPPETVVWSVWGTVWTSEFLKDHQVILTRGEIRESLPWAHDMNQSFIPGTPINQSVSNFMEPERCSDRKHVGQCLASV